ncbi:hypothetical protein [Massilia glaciei]|uniref:Transmembrane protein n=1 Tax=Massilia glaciei TaxID=1524097 RepID=A0A2U2HIS6_9BURK|nr:hypothetical protein [Massilia glaciei]PWF46660.1 hypothetical protein C7C56_015960 [Massilia glaciei]
MRTISIRTILTCTLAAIALAACSPKYNWRDYTSPDAPYSVLFPEKPISHKRTIDLDGMQVEMTMTAAQVDGITFAVGSAQAPDAAKAEAALAAMQTALLRNIDAKITKQSTRAQEKTGPSGPTRSSRVDVEATGAQKGVPMRLVGRFEARDKRFYQVIVMGKDKVAPREQVEMFMSSFKLQ